MGKVVAMIALTCGRYVLVDAEDLPKVSVRSWSLTSNGYARACFDHMHVTMHRLIMGARPGQVVDHINGNKLDNRKENLRVCTQQQNTWNKRKVKDGKTLPKGVTLQRNRTKPYRAAIVVNRKKIHLGCFLTIEEAERAYNQAALFYYGLYAPAYPA